MPVSLVHRKDILEDCELGSDEESAEDRVLRYQIDIQVTPKQLLVLKIFEGDSAQEIMDGLESSRKL